MMTKHTERFRKQLTRMSQIIGQTAADIEERTAVPTGGQADGGLSNVPMHLADISTDVSLQEANSVILDNERRLYDEVNAALFRLENGTFGFCEACGETISGARLDAVPYARKCFDCATKEESESQDAPAWRSNPDDVGIAGEDGQPMTLPFRRGDQHAAGTAGGGTAVGGLGGTNIGHGDPDESDLERAMASSDFDANDRIDHDDEGENGFSDREGNAVGIVSHGRDRAVNSRIARDDVLTERKPRRRRRG